MGLRALGRRLAWLWRRGRFADELNEEMQLHVQLRARQLEEQGIERREAHYMAQRRFGNRTGVLDAASAAWGWGAWTNIGQDLRIGARSLRKAPGFTAVAVLTLAVGLGLNTAVFSMVSAAMIRGLPYPQTHQLVSLWEEYGRREPDIRSGHGTTIGSAGGPRRMAVSVANLLNYRAGAPSFVALASHEGAPMNLTGAGRPERVQGERVSSEFFSVLWVAPAIGRAFLPEDDREGAPPVAILTHAFWQRRFGGDPAVLGRSLMLDGSPYRVIGVLPAGFQAPSEFALPLRPEFFVPGAYSRDLLANHGDHGVNVVARLRPGASIQAPQAELDRVSAGLAAQYPQTNQGVRAAIAPLRDDLVRGVRDSLWVLLGATGVIVLISCLNVANLLLVRAVARRHECSVRLALGAGRGRMVRQFLAESLLLAMAGCVAGVLLGGGLMRLALALAPADLPQIRGATMDWRVFLVCSAVAALSGVFFGIAPAWQASGARPSDSLKTNARTGSGKTQVQWRAALTVAEVSLSLILTIGAGLLIKSFASVMGVDLGFQPDRVLAMNVNLSETRYATPEQRLQFFERLAERVAALPGVQSVAYANRMPLRGGWGTGIEVETAPGVTPDADSQAVSPGYFATLGLQLVRGRFLTPDDREGAPHVAVVNQAFVRQRLEGADPTGKRLRRGRAPWVEIVGVVNDIRRAGKTADITPQVYFPAGQVKLYPVRLADFAVRTAGDPRHLVNAIQDEIWALDKDQPVTNVRTLDEIVSESAALRRFETALLVLFAGVAVTLALIGIFGVLSYAVTQRRPELGLRMALGAAPRDIVALVLRQAGALIAYGVAIGLAGALALTRYLESLLFHVRAADWQSYAAAALLLVSLALTAALIPAFRGAKADPMTALRAE
ncbi:MAG TPA: ABC transporter permease [Gemmataceae bacterium]|nr:ABC transporter permease [Gemmataceae bacterium]